MGEGIKCPSCGAKIDVSSALSAELNASIRAELERDFRNRTSALEGEKERLKKRELELNDLVAAKVAAGAKEKEDALRRAILTEMEAERQESVKLRADLKAAKDRDLAVRKRELELRDKEQDVELRVTKMTQEAVAKNEAAIRRAAEDKAALASAEKDRLLAERAERLAQLEANLKRAGEDELKLRKREQQLLDEKARLELDVARRLAEERETIRAAAKKEAGEDYLQRIADKDRHISELKKTTDDLTRKLDMGSQQQQGEVQEDEIERMLRDAFRSDEVAPVAKGVRGGDVKHKVIDGRGRDCGTILWESKRTKNWSAGWLAKARDDQRDAGAAHVVIVTQAMPDGCDTFTQLERVWVTSRRCAAALAAALRTYTIALADAHRMADGKHEKIEGLYRYLTSPEFRNRVTGIADAFDLMRKDLDAERRLTQARWSKREQHINQGMENIATCFGGLQGVIGPEVRELKQFELPLLPGGDGGAQAKDGDP